MVQVVTKEEIQKAIGNNEIVANFCNSSDYEVDSGVINDALDECLLYLCTTIKSKRKTIDKYVAFATDYGDKKAVTVEYKIGKVKQKMRLDIMRAGFDKFIRRLCDMINLSINGAEAVGLLNDKISEVQISNNSTVMYKYMISQSEKCDIYEWDYDKVIVRLSNKASLRLIEKYENDAIADMVNEVDWTVGICEFVDKFNEISLHEKLSANLEGMNVKEKLKENMLDSTDITIILGKVVQANNDIDVITTLSIVNELGEFAIICNWVIDDNQLELGIMYNKVLDLDTGKFVSNRDIVERLKGKIYKQCIGSQSRGE